MRSTRTAKSFGFQTPEGPGLKQCENHTQMGENRHLRENKGAYSSSPTTTANMRPYETSLPWRYIIQSPVEHKGRIHSPVRTIMVW